EADVALAGRAEERPGGGEDAVVEQLAGEQLGGLVDGDPEEEARIAARMAQPFALERGKDGVPLAPVELAHVRDVRLVRPGYDRCALYELLRRGAGRGPERAQ